MLTLTPWAVPVSPGAVAAATAPVSPGTIAAGLDDARPAVVAGVVIALIIVAVALTLGSMEHFLDVVRAFFAAILAGALFLVVLVLIISAAAA